MSWFGRLVLALCRIAFAGDVGKQREVSSVVAEVVGAGRGRWLRELGGLAALTLGQVSDRSCSHGYGVVRSAAALAAPAAFFATAGSLAAAMDPVSGSGWLGVALFAAAGVLAACRSRAPAVVLGGLAVWPAAVAAGPAIIAAGVIALAATVAIPSGAGRESSYSLAAFYLAVGIAAGLAVLAGLPVLDDGLIRVATLAVASVLIVLGWFDPRYALVAAVVFGCRFAMFDLVGLGEAFAGLGRDLTVDELVIRWVAMAAGLIVSLVTARRSSVRISMV